MSADELVPTLVLLVLFLGVIDKLHFIVRTLDIADDLTLAAGLLVFEKLAVAWLDRQEAATG